MANVIRTIDLRRLNEGFSSKFRIVLPSWHETPEEGCMIHRLKREYNNKDEDISPNTVNDKNCQVSYPKF